MDKNYSEIKSELDSIEVSASPLNIGDEISVVDAIKECTDSYFFKKYNQYKFNHLLNGYDAFSAMSDYFKKTGMVVTFKK